MRFRGLIAEVVVDPAKSLDLASRGQLKIFFLTMVLIASSTGAIEYSETGSHLLVMCYYLRN